MSSQLRSLNALRGEPASSGVAFHLTTTHLLILQHQKAVRDPGILTQLGILQFPCSISHSDVFFNPSLMVLLSYWPPGGIILQLRLAARSPGLDSNLLAIPFYSFGSKMLSLSLRLSRAQCSLYMDQLQKLLDNDELKRLDHVCFLKVTSGHSFRCSSSPVLMDDEYVDMTRNKFLQYTRLDIPEFRNTLIQHMESMEYVKKSIDERALHKREHDSRVNERQTQMTMEKDTSSRSGNDADIRPIYNEELMAEVQTTAEINIFATGQQHIEQPKFNNEGKVDQNAEQCHDIRPLPAKLTDNRTTELSNQLLESENVCLKKTVAQCQKDFAKLEAHCINLELQMQNNVLKSRQQSQFLKEKSNEAKVKNDIDVTKTIIIELEHSVAKLLAENEHLKQTYKDLFDSIKRTRVQTKDQNESLMAQLNKKSNENADEKKGFAIAALKNELRKLTGNSVNTKFA
ncbi:hypothetical protein Tco_1281390, partial [Tanacetum coccineum]